MASAVHEDISPVMRTVGYVTEIMPGSVGVSHAHTVNLFCLRERVLGWRDGSPVKGWTHNPEM